MHSLDEVAIGEVPLRKRDGVSRAFQDRSDNGGKICVSAGSTDE
jgi:hypothetical protein